MRLSGEVARLRKELGSASAEEEVDLHVADADLTAAKRGNRARADILFGLPHARSCVYNFCIIMLFQ